MLKEISFSIFYYGSRVSPDLRRLYKLDLKKASSVSDAFASSLPSAVTVTVSPCFAASPITAKIFLALPEVDPFVTLMSEEKEDAVFTSSPAGRAWIKSALGAAGAAGSYGYAIALSAATAIDLGGPINKAAGFVALSFTTDKLLPITARCIAIVVPSIGLGLATIIDKLVVGRHDAERPDCTGRAGDSGNKLRSF